LCSSTRSSSWSWCAAKRSCLSPLLTDAIRYVLLKWIPVVSRKFDSLLLVPLDRYKFSRIFVYKVFSGGVLLSHNTVNELCYVAQFVNSVMTNKTLPLNVEYSIILYENDIFKNV
jgi:hypothetical protein